MEPSDLESAHTRLDNHRKVIDDLARRVAALEGKQQTPAPEPRPKLMYVDEVPADGTCEIRWWNSASAEWTAWRRVLQCAPTPASDRRTFWIANDEVFSPPRSLIHMKRDECVQVRSVFDPQTGDTLGEVA